eukprot:CAMPEP_0113233810 /NCGR_PEP_ID=MMETSP0008_2-20120614/2686_1 /TAXON_ID=97485 /ORGANISM="Prymnesium parvum" /LENGTH=101 /DNA_ID=CAMNT_0000080625 /DNA_START=690 /DNA_END=995 /DNA_ORIENTATION=+ /assembly_acc=CAM_ASM_000153
MVSLTENELTRLEVSDACHHCQRSENLFFWEGREDGVAAQQLDSVPDGELREVDLRALHVLHEELQQAALRQSDHGRPSAPVAHEDALAKALALAQLVVEL